ncbi:MAG: PIN domain-containing protein [Lysobacteraceae bacterium]
MAMLDTHIAVALYQGKTQGLSRQALAMIDSEPLLLSPAVLLELELLQEIGRTRHGAAAVAGYLAEQLDIPCASERFAEVVRHALPLGFTRDPFDRLIVAHAALLRRPLITQDGLLRQHYPLALA